MQVNAYITLLPSYIIRTRLLVIKGKQREKQDSWHFPPKSPSKAIESSMCCTLHTYGDEYLHSVPVHLDIAYFCPCNSRYSIHITHWVTEPSTDTMCTCTKHAPRGQGAQQCQCRLNFHGRGKHMEGISTLGRSKPWIQDRKFLFGGQVHTLDSRTYFPSRNWWTIITTFRVHFKRACLSITCFAVCWKNLDPPFFMSKNMQWHLKEGSMVQI